VPLHLEVDHKSTDSLAIIWSFRCPEKRSIDTYCISLSLLSNLVPLHLKVYQKSTDSWAIIWCFRCPNKSIILYRFIALVKSSATVPGSWSKIYVFFSDNMILSPSEQRAAAPGSWSEIHGFLSNNMILSLPNKRSIDATVSLHRSFRTGATAPGTIKSPVR